MQIFPGWRDALPSTHACGGQRGMSGRSGNSIDGVGGLVTETLDFDSGRDVTAYVPMKSPEVIVFAGDGQLLPQWGEDLERSDLPSTMIVGVHRLADEAQRLHEYSPIFDAERFAAHETFLIDVVRHWTNSRLGVALPAERTAVLGVSAGGATTRLVGQSRWRTWALMSS
jgi:hypothetical protein